MGLSRDFFAEVYQRPGLGLASVEERKSGMETGFDAGGRKWNPRMRAPRPGGSVWPDQACPAFAPRSVGLGCMGGCWYCRYGNFHLRERVALDVGICCWPKTQMD